MPQVRVLVVDDDDFWRNEVRAVAESLGCEVTVAADAKAADIFLAQQPFDLLITDNFMRNYNAGIDLLRRNQQRELPAILHTSSLSTVQKRAAEGLTGVIAVVKSTVFGPGGLDHAALKEAIQQSLRSHE